MSKDNIYKVGIAGYGIVGKRRRKFIDAHPSLQTSAVCDITFKESGSFEDGVNFYTDYESMLSASELDIVFVCMPNDIAPLVTIKCIEKNKHVFCEKPPGRNLKDIESVMEAERGNKNIKLMYGFNHRFHESVIEALGIIRSKKLGEIINIRGVYGKSQLITFNQPDWRTKREIAGGGVLLDQGIHMVDLMRLFAGEFSEVYSFIENSHWNYNVEDNAYALMRTESGKVAMLNSSATQWRHRFNIDINLQKGSLILGGILSGSKSYGAETLTIVESNPTNDRGDPMEVRKRYNNDPSWESEINEFVECIINNYKISSSSLEAFKTMELVYKIYSADLKWKLKYKI